MKSETHYAKKREKGGIVWTQKKIQDKCLPIALLHKNTDRKRRWGGADREGQLQEI